eukprot:CAMPEP_0171084156 /NCGR_PEP_ID=MMETSP0766_2-20121228/18147_1 /TAXON_ID=439317 /ORGANISM="Gambierdiscus australes, Strain CAWD 149" /LENGTH=42 /DNA_ID= /DNA_START= /DNA_END= /DNA_ORIENTATION=
MHQRDGTGNRPGRAAPLSSQRQGGGGGGLGALLGQPAAAKSQ